MAQQNGNGNNVKYGQKMNTNGNSARREMRDEGATCEVRGAGCEVRCAGCGWCDGARSGVRGMLKLLSEDLPS